MQASAQALGRGNLESASPRGQKKINVKGSGRGARSTYNYKVKIQSLRSEVNRSGRHRRPDTGKLRELTRTLEYYFL